MNLYLFFKCQIEKGWNRCNSLRQGEHFSLKLTKQWQDIFKKFGALYLTKKFATLKEKIGGETGENEGKMSYK